MLEPSSLATTRARIVFQFTCVGLAAKIRGTLLPAIHAGDCSRVVFSVAALEK